MSASLCLKQLLVITLLPWKQQHIWCLQNSTETVRIGAKAAVPGVHSCIIATLLFHLSTIAHGSSGTRT